jgi:hypothetical protein
VVVSRVEFHRVDHPFVDEIGVYDVDGDIAASVIGFRGNRAVTEPILEFSDYAKAYSIMTAYGNVPLYVISAFVRDHS